MGFNLPLLNLRRRLLGSGVSFSPVELFTLSEPGIWLDPSDVANLDWRRNLLEWSENASNAYWTKNVVTVSGQTLTATGTGGPQFSRNGLVNAAGTYTLTSRFTNSGTSPWAVIYISDSSLNYVAQWINLSTGALGSLQAVGTGWSGTATRTNVGGGVYDLTLTVTKPSTANSTVSPAHFANGDLSFNATNGSTIVWQRAQLELGSTATEYQPITTVDAGVIARFPSATLYQDTAGTTPVTTPGQSVALALDKSKGLVLGSELVTNGDFSSGTANWTPQDGNVVLSTSSGVGVATYSATSSFYQGVSVQAGRTYRATAIIRRASGSGTPFMNFRSGTTLASGVLGEFATSGYTSSSFVFASAWVVAASTTTVYLHFPCTAAASTVFEVDNISVRELPGFHATQATTASRPIYGINPVGGRRNLLTFTEQFDNAAWTKDNSSITANAAIAPDGTTTADKLVEAATTNVHFAGQSVTVAAGSHSFSAYLKAAERTFAILYYPTGNVAIAVNLSTGATGQPSGTVAPASSSVTSVGNGWYRVSMVVTTTAASQAFRIYLSDTLTGTGSYTGNGTSGILIWGAQLETGSTATAYQKVTTQYDVTEAGVSSLSYLFFDGVDDVLVAPNHSFTFTGGISAFAGFLASSFPTFGTLFSAGTTGVTGTNNSRSIGFQITNDVGISGRPRWCTDIWSPSGVTSAPTLAASTRYVASYSIANWSTHRSSGTAATVNGADQTVTVYGASNPTALNAGPMRIGSFDPIPLPSGFFNGQLYSLIIRGAQTSAETVSQTNTWINGKTRAY